MHIDDYIAVSNLNKKTEKKNIIFRVFPYQINESENQLRIHSHTKTGQNFVEF